MKETARSRRWTYQDYLVIPDDGKRRQIVRGEMFVTPAPTPSHQRSTLRLAHAIMKFLESKDLGEVFISPIDMVLADDSVVQPDVLYISRERLAIIGEKAITAAGDLAIEVLSPSTRKLDLVKKRDLYADYGVREYWIVDPEKRRIEVFVLEHGAYAKRADVSEGPVGSAAALPGFSVDLKEVFG